VNEEKIDQAKPERSVYDNVDLLDFGGGNEKE